MTGIELGTIEPDALEDAPSAVIEVKAQCDVGDDVERCDRSPGKRLEATLA